MLEVKDARDAFLSSLCSFALPSKLAEDADLDLPMSPASVTSPSGAKPFQIDNSFSPLFSLVVHCKFD